MKKKKMDGKKKMDKGKQADKAAQTNQTTADSTTNDQKRQMRTRTCKCRFLSLATEGLANFRTRVFSFVAQTYVTSEEGNELIR